MRCRRSSAAVSSKVRSGCSVITATTRSACCSSGETLPPRGFGAALLLSLQRCIHLTTELTLTPKCSAASCRDAPASTISIARSRKSQEYDFGIVTPRVRESMLKQSPIHDRLGIPRFKSAGSRFSSELVIGRLLFLHRDGSQIRQETESAERSHGCDVKNEPHDVIPP